MKVEEPDLAGTYTYADYLTWQWDERLELIRSKIYKMSPGPNTRHQQITGELHRQMSNLLRKKKCQVFIAPYDVRLPVPGKKKSNNDITTVVQPDVCVVCDPSKIDEAGCLGAPDLIIEVLSPFTSSKDLRLKFDVYEESGVKEYWVVYPVEEIVTVYVLDQQGKFVSTSGPFIRSDRLASQSVPGLVVELEDVFPDKN
ncbi:MAG: Uma2 family endonuclease [Cyclobacteriaceae bacterium]|nr:Uma2 family endonuclease [Cyclobacteriaceae bacterium]